MTAFFATHILVYAFLDPEKRQQAIITLAQGGIIPASKAPVEYLEEADFDA